MNVLKKKTKCYIYTRVSTAIQVDGYSLDAQKDKLRKYAEFQDIEIGGEYSDGDISNAYLAVNLRSIKATKPAD